MQDDKKKLRALSTSAPERETTLPFILPNPKIDGFNFLNASLRLHTLRQHLSGFTIAEDHDNSKMDYSVFLRHMLGVRDLSVDAVKMHFVRTNSSIFLVSESRENQFFIRSNLPEIDVEKRYVLTNGVDAIHLCRLTVLEFEKIESLAKQSVDLNELKRKLSQSVPQNGSLFDVQSFVVHINSASSYNDNSDRVHFIIDYDDGKIYSIYVNVNPKEHEENKLLYTGKFENETFYLYHVEVI